MFTSKVYERMMHQVITGVEFNCKAATAHHIELFRTRNNVSHKIMSDRVAHWIFGWPVKRAHDKRAPTKERRHKSADI